MFLDSLCDPFPRRLQVIKCLHHQLNFSHVTGCKRNRLYILPSELNLAKCRTGNKRQGTYHIPVADGLPGIPLDQKHMLVNSAHWYQPTTRHFYSPRQFELGHRHQHSSTSGFRQCSLFLEIVGLRDRPWTCATPSSVATYLMSLG
jgi:hypothetical protein